MLCLALRPLTPEEREQSGVAGGLVVERSQGPAAAAGIQEDDVLLGVNGEPVKSAEQLRNLVRNHQQLALLIQRGNDRLFVPIQVG